MAQPWTTAILLGVVEGLTEFLPVSSTGHLLLAQSYLTRQSDLFNVVIQAGAVSAVLLLLGGRLRQLWGARQQPDARAYLMQLAVSFAITAAGGLIMKALHYRLQAQVLPVALATLIGGVIFVLVEARLARRPPAAGQVTWAVAVAMGLAQILAAVLPGTSRSGATILAALVLGCGRAQATEFSFLLGVPTLLAAGGLQLAGALRDPEVVVDWAPLAVATAVAAVVAFASVRWLLGYVRGHSFAAFGWYRILLGLGLLAQGAWAGG